MKSDRWSVDIHTQPIAIYANLLCCFNNANQFSPYMVAIYFYAFQRATFCTLYMSLFYQHAVFTEATRRLPRAFLTESVGGYECGDNARALRTAITLQFPHQCSNIYKHAIAAFKQIVTVRIWPYS